MATKHRSIDDLPEGHIPRKKMFHIEKFLPVECPKCRAKFEQQNKDWSLLLGDIVDGKKVVRQSDGHDIIICAHCENYTARIMLETYQLADRDKAVELMEKEGFINLQEVIATGTHCKDMHAVYTKKPGLKVLGLKCDDNEDGQ